MTLHNIQILRPREAVAMINTYRSPLRLFQPGGGELVSQGGTTQGDPLAIDIPFYLVSISILIYSLRIQFESVKQVWLADARPLLEIFIYHCPF